MLIGEIHSPNRIWQEQSEKIGHQKYAQFSHVENKLYGYYTNIFDLGAEGFLGSIILNCWIIGKFPVASCQWINSLDSLDSLDNLIGQNVIMWGCINGWYMYRLAHQKQRGCASCFVQCAAQISTNQSDEYWHYVPDSCTLEVFHVSPKHEYADFYLASFQQK